MKSFLTFLVCVFSIVAGARSICVRPTDSNSNAHPSDNNCPTLNEVIDKHDSSNFLSSRVTVSVRLLPGIHLVNSTRYRLLVRNTHIVSFKGENATISCVKELSFVFMNCNFVQLSGLTFESCTLLFSYVRNLRIVHLSVINNWLTITSASKRDIEWNIIEGQCESYAQLQVVNTNFSNSGISVKKSYFNGIGPVISCIKVGIVKVVFKDIVTNTTAATALALPGVRTAIITDTIFQNIHASSLTAFTVYNLSLTNVAFVNNCCSRSLLDLQYINTLKLMGNCNFKFNNNSDGIVVKKVKYIVSTKAKLIFIRNEHDHVFSYEGYTDERKSSLSIKTNTELIFENNIARKAIFLTENVVFFM